MKWSDITNWNSALPEFALASDVEIDLEYWKPTEIRSKYQFDGIWYLSIVMVAHQGHQNTERDIDLNLLMFNEE